MTDRLKLPWAIGAPLTSPSRRLFLSPVGTPRNRDNMIAWIAARSDFPGYGEMIVYKLSKDYLILGPLQIKATIDQDTTISRQLTLWDQRGSRVIRGNLLVIPINQSFLYVEPVFLIAEGTNISAAQAGHRQRRQPPSDGIDARGGSPSHFRRAPSIPEETMEVPQAPISGPREALSRADQALRRGDWTAFGRAWEQLKSLLEEK